ncbi:MAG: hypothetical protein K2Y26_16540 [Gemmatimonadaceae bacterium]|jgi:NH3-dependent NAD+ synthetase|nr:hypothetical protein [Gemmatimonadaceae bacterium]
MWAGQTDESELGFTYAEADYVLHRTNGADALSKRRRRVTMIAPWLTRFSPARERARSRGWPNQCTRVSCPAARHLWLDGVPQRAAPRQM